MGVQPCPSRGPPGFEMDILRLHTHRVRQTVLHRLRTQCQYFHERALTLSQAASNAWTTSSGRGPFSKFTRFSSSCFALDAPMITASPCSRLSNEWCVIHRKAASASVIPCFFTTGRMISKASKYASFQYRTL